ncbi:hypothetical protein HA402_008791 [Bradysia odoriphaga]|nr:hypothetical protein HA402_008791 [Bradysia odoriphaga]
MEMLHSKSLHYPSGYPMTRSPPLFVCSSPGPDPYRSHDNVYEELGPPRDSDAESDIALHSDDDFAEDESSLPGERSMNKLSSHDVTPTVATIYHERVAAGGGGAGVNVNGGCCLIDRSANERNSLLSSSSSDRNGCGSSSGYGNDKSVRSAIRSSASPDSGLFRGGRRLFNSRAKQRTYSTDELNTSSEQTPSDVVPTIYDERNLLTLPYSHSNSNSFSNHSSSHRNKSINCCNSTVANDDVERRNHLNNQLSSNAVSTIYRGRTMANGRNQPSLNYHNSHSSRSRTNPRSLDRRRINTALPSPSTEASYVYPEPMFHDGMVYDSCLNHQLTDRNHLYPYILPEFTSFRNMTNSASGTEQPNQPIHPIYSRDSSFGSDSGYSHHTQTSGRGGGSAGGVGNQSGALSSLWARNKENTARKGNNTFDAS